MNIIAHKVERVNEMGFMQVSLVVAAWRGAIMWGGLERGGEGGWGGGGWEGERRGGGGERGRGEREREKERERGGGEEVQKVLKKCETFTTAASLLSCSTKISPPNLTSRLSFP